MARQRDPGQGLGPSRKARLRARQTHGDAAERAKAAFLSVLSHELRTPLNTILGQADLLSDDGLPPQAREAIAAIRDAGHGLHTLLNDLLELAKLEAGGAAVEHAELDIRALTDGVRRLSRPRAWAQELDFEVTVARDVPRLLTGDASKIRQTLINLTGNALKFTERGGVSITVEMTARRDALRIAVADTGIGIAADEQARLFAPFEQSEQVLTRRRGGLGLGLALCTRLVRAMGGTIGVESKPGAGSIFWFTAPVRILDEDVAAPAEDGAIDALLAARVKGMRVLIADDNALHRAALARMMERAGVAATLVGDGLEAVAAAGRDPFDAIVLDAHMPQAGGLQAARMMRTLQRQDQVFIALACAEGDSAEADAAACCDAVIRKPYETDALLACLVRARSGAASPVALDIGTVEELERSVGRPVLVDVLKSFLASAAEMMARIEAAMPAEDVGALEQASRDLAGAASGLGLAALTAAARDLSAGVRQGLPARELAGQVTALAGMSAETRERLTALYPDLRAA